MLKKIKIATKQNILIFILITLVFTNIIYLIPIAKAEDTTPPVVTINTPSNNSIFELGTNVSYTYSVVDDNPTTVEVKLNSSVVSDTGNLTGLEVGRYNLTVEATDNSSNFGWDKITFFVQDTITPIVTITSPANDSTSELGTSVIYSYTVDDLSPTTNVVRLDGDVQTGPPILSNLAVGPHVLNVNATDDYGNSGADEVIFFVVDTATPVVTIDSPADSSTFEVGLNVTYAYTVTDLSSTTVVVRLNGTIVADTGELTSLVVGTHILNITATDSSNNVGSDQITFFVTDTIAPVVAITSPANSSTFELGTDITYTYTVDDAGTTVVTIKLNGEIITDTGTLTGLNVGTYTLLIEANDTYNAIGSDQIIFFVNDTTVPIVTINTPFNGSTHEFGLNVTYTYTITDLSGTTVVIRLNGTVIADTGELTSLAIGTYTLSVEATDSSNNIGTDEIIFFVTDTTAPIVTITSPVNASSFEFGTSVTYSYTVDDLSTTTTVVRLDGEIKTGPPIFTNLAVGPHVLNVNATDNYGNSGIDEVIFFVVDTTNPVVTIDSPADSSTFEFGLNVTYAYTVTDLSGTTVVIRLNGAVIADTGLLTDLTVGTHVLNITVTDSSNNVGSDQITFFVTDTTAPIVTIDSPVDSSTFEFGLNVTYAYTVTDLSGTTVVIRLNGAVVADTGELTGLAVGAHVLNITATDSSNNVGSDQITFYVTDTTAPVVTIDSPADSSTFEFSLNVTYVYTVTDLSGTTVVIRLNGAVIADTGELTSLAVGTHVLNITATDSSNNVGSDQITFFVTDTTSPIVTIDSPADSSTFEFGLNVTYAYTVTDLSGMTVVVLLNGTVIADTGELTGLAVGTHILNITATDSSNNVGSDQITFFVTDTTAPIVTITSPADSSTFEFGLNVTYTYTITDLSGTTVVVRLNGTVVADTGLLTSLAYATYTLSVEATDSSNNVDSDQITFFVTDTTAPVVTIDSPADSSTFEFGLNVTYTYTITDLNGTTVLVLLNGSVVADIGLLTNLAVGTHTLIIEATDSSNNVGSDQITFFVTDTTSPIVTIDSPADSSTFEFGLNVTYAYTVTDLSGTTVVVKLNGAVIADTGELTSLAVGTHILNITATDSSNNVGSDQITFYVTDTTAPVVTIDSPTDSSTFEFGLNVTYAYTVTDLSGTTVVVKLNGSVIADTGELTSLAVGTHILNITATDSSNNVGSDQITFFVTDTTSPIVTIDSPADSSTFEFGLNVTYAYTVTDLSGTTAVVRLNGTIVADIGLLTNLAVGTYTLNIEATDSFNNVGSDQINFFVTDTTAPIVTITSPVDSSTFEFGLNVTYTYTVTDLSGTTVVVRLDGATITDTGLLTSLTIGTHTLEVETTDTFNNIGSDQITIFVEDTTAPVVTITSPANSSIFEFGVDVSYSYTVDDLSSTTVVVKLNGAIIPDTDLLANLVAGTYTLVIEATDPYNNVGSDEITFFMQDTTDPVVIITSPANNTVFEFGDLIFYEYTATDLNPIVTVVKLDNVPITDNGVLINLAVGTYILRVEATDTENNVGFDEIIFFVEDTTKPVVTIDAPMNGSTFEFGSNITYSYLVDELSAYTTEVILDGVLISDTGLLTDLAVGLHTIRVEATDSSNNVGYDEITIFVEDTTVPLVFILAPVSDVQYPEIDPVPLDIQVIELANYTIIVSVDDTVLPVDLQSGVLPPMSIGMHFLKITVIDASNNIGSALTMFEVVEVPASIDVTLISPNGGEVIASDYWNITWTIKNPRRLDVTFDLYYNINQSDIWVVIASDVVGTSYDWDTTSLVTSFVYQIKIEAETIYNSTLLTRSDVSDNYFTVAQREITIQLTIPDTLPTEVTAPGFELPIVLLVGLSIFLYRRKRR